MVGISMTIAIIIFSIILLATIHSGGIIFLIWYSHHDLRTIKMTYQSTAEDRLFGQLGQASLELDHLQGECSITSPCGSQQVSSIFQFNLLPKDQLLLARSQISSIVIINLLEPGLLHQLFSRQTIKGRHEKSMHLTQLGGRELRAGSELNMLDST